MPETFKFSPRQRTEIIKELGNEKWLRYLEEAVEDYRRRCQNRVAPAEIRDRLKDTLRLAGKLRHGVLALEQLSGASADWITEPLQEYQTNARALLDFRFKDRLKQGRLPHIPEVQMIQATAEAWRAIHGKPPGRGRGPFSRLVGKMLRYSGVPGAPTKYPEELVEEAVPFRLSLRAVGPEYPFDIWEPGEDLPPMKRAAKTLFSRIDFVSRGAPTISLIVQTDSSGSGNKHSLSLASPAQPKAAKADAARNTGKKRKKT